MANNPTVISKTSSDFDINDLDAEYLKTNYLVGLKLLGDDGCELPEAFFQTHIDNAIATIEDMASIDILPREVTAETHDYLINDYVQYAFLQLYRVPIQDVNEVRAVYPTGQTIQTFPSEWIRLMIEHGQLHLIPTSGSLSQVIIGQGADYLPLIFSGLGKLPNLWEVDYTSGFAVGCTPRIIIDAIAKMASISILTIMSDLVHPIGVSSSSLSVDGLSQSRSLQLPAFKQRIDRYSSELYNDSQDQPGLIRQIRNKYLGIALSSV